MKRMICSITAIAAVLGALAARGPDSSRRGNGIEIQGRRQGS